MYQTIEFPLEQQPLPTPQQSRLLPRLGLLLLCLAGLFSLTLPILAANPGDLDPSFGNGGVVTTTFGSPAIGLDIAIQSDGKIVLIGGNQNGSPFISFALARYDSNGSLESEFGNGGVITTPIGDAAVGSAVAVQSNDKIVVAGYSFYGAQNAFALARYNSNGSLDSEFGSSGVVTTPIGSSNSNTLDMILQPDGKIIIAGSKDRGDGFFHYDFTLARYNSNGSLDNEFGNGGIVTTTIGNYAFGYAVAFHNGKIVAAGTSYNGSQYTFALARYNNDGSLDSEFGSGGIVTTAIGNYASISTIAIQSDGKIIAVGSALARYTITGSLDSTFGNGGIITNPAGSAIAIQSDGRIILAGTSSNGSLHTFVLGRYTITGSLHTEFGNGGVVTTPIGSEAFGTSVVLQFNERVVVAGHSIYGNQRIFALARYLTEAPAPAPIPSSGGTITPTQGVILTANSDVFSETVLITYTPHPITPTDSLSNIGFFYELDAVYQSSGLPAQPQPGQHYAITVTYQQANVPAGVNEVDLALYYWDGVAWVKEPTSVVDVSTNTITATPNHFSLWAALAPSFGLSQQTTFLPIILKQ